MVKGCNTYVPKFMLDEIRRISQKKNLEGRNRNVVAMSIIVRNSRVGEEIEKLQAELNQELELKRQPGRKKLMNNLYP